MVEETRKVSDPSRKYRLPLFSLMRPQAAAHELEGRVVSSRALHCTALSNLLCSRVSPPIMPGIVVLWGFTLRSIPLVLLCLLSQKAALLTDTPLNRAGFAMKLGRAGDRFYCGRRLGMAAIPGSDGQCGPTNGPQCADCLWTQQQRQVRCCGAAVGCSHTCCEQLSVG